MCDFVSWIEYQDEIFYLTNADLRTKRGRELRQHLGAHLAEDIQGHGAIRFYYEIPQSKGVNKECSDFSTPDNFPPTIVKDIKRGAFSEIANDLPIGILKQQAWDEYVKVEKQAWDEYIQVKQIAWSKYQDVLQQAWDEYDRLHKIPLDEYNVVKVQLRTKYIVVKNQAQDKYDKVRHEYFWNLVTKAKNRVAKWR